MLFNPLTKFQLFFFFFFFFFFKFQLYKKSGEGYNSLDSSMGLGLPLVVEPNQWLAKKSLKQGLLQVDMIKIVFSPLGSTVVLICSSFFSASLEVDIFFQPVQSLVENITATT